MFEVRQGDCREVMAEMEPASVDAIVTDPPYGLGFMGKGWDHGIPGEPFWTAALRVAKPGAHLLAFGGTRTFHRLTCALEDAGWEIRDCLMWLYGSGFPKSKNIGGGWGTALKPAWEPIILARKPLVGTVAANVQEHGTGALNVDGCRIEATPRSTHSDGNYRGERGVVYAGAWQSGVREQPATGRWPANVCLDEWDDPVLCLRDNVDPQVARVIRLYFGQVQDVPEAHTHLPEPEGPEEVLRTGVLREGPKEADGQTVGPLRDKAHGGSAGTNGGSAEGESGHRSEGLNMEGRPAPRSGIRHGKRGASESGGADVALADAESVKRSMHPGAPSGDGSAAGASTEALGDRPSPERRQDGQQTGQSGNIGQRNPQTGPRRDTPRVAAVASRERSLEVRASEIPPGWLNLFAPTGRSVRCGSAAMLDAQSGDRGAFAPVRGTEPTKDGFSGGVYGSAKGRAAAPFYGDGGGASRFFYTAKASSGERHYAGRNHHPTVKPVDLMRWCCRLVTPPKGLVLDQFCGSGSTGIAALAEGFGFFGIEQDPEMVKLSRRRIGGPLYELSIDSGDGRG